MLTRVVFCPAADKLRTDLTSTQAELDAAKAAKAAAVEAMVSESEGLRLKLGGMKQQMANNAAELERERETAASMKERVSKLNHNFMQTSDKLRNELASTTTDLSTKLQREAAARVAAEAESEHVRLSLGGTKQQMAKTAAELQKEREVAAEMKARVKALNVTYMNSGGWQAAGGHPACACCSGQLVCMVWTSDVHIHGASMCGLAAS